MSDREGGAVGVAAVAAAGMQYGVTIVAKIAQHVSGAC